MNMPSSPSGPTLPGPSPLADLEILQGSILEQPADAIAVNLFAGVRAPGGATGAVDRALGGRLSRVIASEGFEGELGATRVLDLPEDGPLPARLLVLVGLGPAERFDLERVRRAAAAAARAAAAHGARSLASIVHGAGVGGLDPADAAQATVEGGLLAGYRFRAHKTGGSSGSGGRDHESSAKTGNESDDPATETDTSATETLEPAIDSESDGRDVRLASGTPPLRLETLRIVEADADKLEAIESGARVGEAVAAGVRLARDLANHPANVATPRFLAAQAEALAARHGMAYEAWDRARIVGEGMGALASVAAGSHEEPRFIILRHAPQGHEDRAPVVMAGKAVTFDTGGISLKPGLKMGLMKFDMSGGAAVLGAMETVGRLGLPLHAVGLVGATDNMPDGKATRPGDVVTARDGTTIEILNTDAEGRLVLADALAYARDLRPAAVVDLATLTGAVVVALGKGAAGCFSSDDALCAALESAASRAGEPIWRMPLWDEPYAELLKSQTADLKNTLDGSPGGAGAIFGAKFLERFTDYPWAHLDIAGMAWGDEDKAYRQPGATGYGVRLLVEWLRRRS